MNRAIMHMSRVLAVMALSTTVALAGPTKTKEKQAKCPVCGMFLAKQATAKSPVAVRLKKGGPVFYCCTKCTMPKSALVKSRLHKM